MRKLTLVCALWCVAGCVVAVPVAVAADPGFNFAPRPTCTGTAACEVQAIRFLDQARAKLGQGPYDLPQGFDSLNPARQALVLTDLDRVMYGLRPIPGLSAELDQAAAAGARTGNDPMPANPNILTFASNWAGGYRNILFAYEAWMYDDGPGGNNFDCTTSNRSGCWAHRHDILWQFDGTGPLAMGAAAGVGPGGALGFTVVLAQYAPGYRAAYTYTWDDAVAAGAGQAVADRSPSRGGSSCVRARRRTRHRRRHSARCRSR